MPVLKKYLENLILDCNRSVLSILAWCQNEAYSVNEMENNLCLFEKSQIQLNLNNSGVNKNQSWKCC